MSYKEKGNGSNPLSVAEQLHKGVGKLVKGNIWDIDFAPLYITKENRENLMRPVYTDEEDKRERDRMLGVKLP